MQIIGFRQSCSVIVRRRASLVLGLRVFPAMSMLIKTSSEDSPRPCLPGLTRPVCSINTVTLTVTPSRKSLTLCCWALLGSAGLPRPRCCLPHDTDAVTITIAIAITLALALFPRATTSQSLRPVPAVTHPRSVSSYALSWPHHVSPPWDDMTRLGASRLNVLNHNRSHLESSILDRRVQLL